MNKNLKRQALEQLLRGNPEPVKQMNRMEVDLSQLTDEEFKKLGGYWRELIQKGESTYSITEAESIIGRKLPFKRAEPIISAWK